MRHFLLSLIFLCFGNGAFAQIGISVQYLNYPLIVEEDLYETNLFDFSYGGAIDYWLRLKNYRWEMVPTLSANFGPKAQTSVFANEADINILATKFHVKNNIYILDFKNDCDCPTFSKQSGWFAKSFFLQVSPGVAMHRLKLDSTIENENETLSRWQAELGLGAGFDIGISDLITISPYFNYVLTSKTNRYFSTTESVLESFRTNHFLVGVRLGLRPDYARPSSMRRRALRY